MPRRISSAEVWPSSSALPAEAPPQVRDLTQLDARADDLRQQHATEDADQVLVHLVAEPAAPVASVPDILAFTRRQLPRLGWTEGLHGSVRASSPLPGGVTPCSSASARTIAGPRMPTDDAGRTRCLLASRACRRWFKPHTQSDFRQLDATTRE